MTFAASARTAVRLGAAVGRHSPRAVCVAALVTFALPRHGAAQAYEAAGALHVLRGTVRAADESRLVGVHVDVLADRALRSGITTVTDADGAFRFDQLPDGAARLVVRRLGFRPETLSVEVPQLPGGPVAVLLERVAQPLTPVFVREARRTQPMASGFDRRRTSGFGHFITRADIERENPQRTTDLLRRVPGLTFSSPDGSPMARFRGGTSGARGCEAVYFLDGSPLGSGGLDVDAIPPSSIEAIEVYNGAATVPAALRTVMAPGGCGAVALWSRRADLARRTRGRTAAVETMDSLDAVVEHGRAFTADQVELAAAPLPGFSPRPVYPDSLRDANVRGRVVAEFVVDERGRVAPETVGIVSSTHPLFAEAVRDAIAGSRFSPAFRDKHVVRQVVHLPVVFEPEVVAGAADHDASPQSRRE